MNPEYSYDFFKNMLFFEFSFLMFQSRCSIICVSDASTVAMMYPSNPPNIHMHPGLKLNKAVYVRRADR